MNYLDVMQELLKIEDRTEVEDKLLTELMVREKIEYDVNAHPDEYEF